MKLSGLIYSFDVPIKIGVAVSITTVWHEQTIVASPPTPLFCFFEDGHTRQLSAAIASGPSAVGPAVGLFPLVLRASWCARNQPHLGGFHGTQLKSHTVSFDQGERIADGISLLDPPAVGIIRKLGMVSRIPCRWCNSMLYFFLLSPFPHRHRSMIHSPVWFL